MPYKEKPEVTADMKVVDKENLLAEGSVTIDGIFIINDVHVRSITKPDGEETLAVLLPKKRNENGRYEPVFSVDPVLKGAINEAVTEDLAATLGTMLSPDKIRVEITPCIRGDFLGYAAFTYKDLFTVSDIRILKDENRDGIRLEFPKSSEKGRSSPLFSMEDVFSINTLTQLVSESYQELMRNREESCEKEAAVR